MHPVLDTRFPNPPGRSERKYRLSSSLDMVGVWSWHRELTGASRCTGSDHSELAKDMAWTLGATGSESDRQPRSRARLNRGVSPQAAVAFTCSPSLGSSYRDDPTPGRYSDQIRWARNT